MSDQSNTHHEQAKELGALKERIRELEAIEAECKQTEAALKENKDKYRLLAENVNDVIYTLDMNLNYTYVSPSAKFLLGYEPSEMLKKSAAKDINDTLGHDTGDLLLKAVTERLSSAMRKSDTVARFGGDEFVLILPELRSIEDATPVAQKIVESFRKPFPINTHQLIVTTSIGIAVYPYDGSGETALLKNADVAMYKAKQTGRNRYQVFKKELIDA